MTQVTFTKMPSGYGHYKLTIELGEATYTTSTSNMPLIDRINSEDDSIALEAKIDAIELVMRDNNIEGELKHEFSNHYQMNTFFIED